MNVFHTNGKFELPSIDKKVLVPFNELLIDGKNIINEVSYLDMRLNNDYEELDGCHTLFCTITLNVYDDNSEVTQAKAVNAIYDDIIELLWLEENLFVFCHFSHWGNFSLSANSNRIIVECKIKVQSDDKGYFYFDKEVEKLGNIPMPYSDFFVNTRVTEGDYTITVEFIEERDDDTFKGFNHIKAVDVVNRLESYGMYVHKTPESIHVTVGNNKHTILFHKVLCEV